jgi:hypothetical protein
MISFLRSINIEKVGACWLRWAVILAVLGLSGIAYQLAGRLPWLFLVGGVGAFVFALLALRDMPLAITLLLLTAATTGVTIGTGTATPLPIGLLTTAGLVGIWVVRMLFFERRVFLRPAPVNAPWLLFLGATVVSTAYGSLLWDWKLPPPQANLLFVQAGQFALYALSFAAAWLTAHHNLSAKDLGRWTLIISLLGIGTMLLEALFGYYGLRSRGIGGSLYTWGVVLIGGQLLFNKDLEDKWRWAAGAALLVFGAWTFRQLDWKSGWVPAILGLGLLLLLRSRKWTLVILVLVGVFALTQQEFLHDLFVAQEIETASTLRPLFWWDIIRMTARSPVLGLGLVNYFFYWADPSFIPISRLAADWEIWNEWGFAPPSHNLFVDVYAQTGLLGLGLFLWGMVAMLYVLIKTLRRTPPGFTRAYVTSILCGFIALLIGSFVFAEWLIPFVYNLTITGFSHSVYSWVLLGSVLGIYFKQEEELRAAQP